LVGRSRGIKGFRAVSVARIRREIQRTGHQINI
jgi:hypothetical protein